MDKQYKMVPTELTHEMEMAMIQAANRSADCSHKDLYAAAIEAAPTQPSPEESDKEAVANCYSNDDGDSWYDCPDDIEFVDGLSVGDEYELSAGNYSWTERFRVVKTPDDTNDDYEVEPVLIRTSVKTKSDKEAVRNAALEEAAKVCDGHAGDIDATGKEPQSWSVVRGAVLVTGDMIRALKSQPAQTSDCRTEFSDTELLRDAITAILWLDRRVPNVYKDMSHIRDTVARLEAAMKAQEGS